MKCSLEEPLKKIGLNGVLKHLGSFAEDQEILLRLIECENRERQERLIARRHAEAKIGHFRSMGEFDWAWPRKIHRTLVEEDLDLRFMEDNGAFILIGPNGVGKTMIAKNIAFRAIQLGKSVHFINAGALLNDLSRSEDARSLERKLHRYERYDLLILDELGYLSYGARHADLLFQLIERRHEKKSLVITTNKTFSEWNTIFPNAACVGALVDRLVQYGDIVNIEADSHRLHQGIERQKKKLQSERTKKNIIQKSRPTEES